MRRLCQLQPHSQIVPRSRHETVPNNTLAHARLQYSVYIQQSGRQSAAMAEDLVPEEIEEQCLQCHRSLVAIDRMLKPVLDVGRLQLEEKVHFSK